MTTFARLAPLALAAAAILALTLWPAPVRVPSETESLLSYRAVADAVANVLLFVPLGAFAMRALGSSRRAVLLAAGLSITIELLQLVVPGRYPAASDIVFNTLGGAAGALLVRTAGWWIDPPAPWRRVLATCALVAALGVTIGGGALLAPVVPAEPLWGQWTAEFENMARYDGRVVRARVGALDVPSRRVARWEYLVALLRARAPVRVGLVAGPPTAGLAPIFSIYDGGAQEVMLLGADGDDAVYRFRMGARTLHLDEPDLRFRDAFADTRPGEATHVTLRRDGRRWCVDVRDRTACDGFTLGDSWGLLLYPVPAALARVLPVLWLAALFLPAGFWLRRAEAAFATILTLAALLAAPAAIGLLPTPAVQIAAAIGGVAAGFAVSRLARRTDERTDQ